MNNLKTLLSLLFISSLMACGGGSSPGSGGEVAVQGGGSSSQMITGLNGRSLAIDTMELLGVTLGYEKYLSTELIVPVSGQCGKGGAKTVVVTDPDSNFGNAGDTVEINYDNCEDSIGNLTFTLNGPLSVEFLSGSFSQRSDSLTINDKQGNMVVTGLDQSVNTAANPNTLTANMSIASSRFGLQKVKAVSDQPFSGANLLCPDSGKLTLTASDNTSVTINGAPGDNLSLVVNGENETLACKEIAVNQAPSSGGDGLAPPGAP